MDNTDKFSTMIIDGQIIDLNRISYEKLNEIQANLEKKQEELRKKIDIFLEKK